MLAGLLRHRNISALSVPVHTSTRKRLEMVEQQQPAVICVSALSPRFAIFARQMARRLRHARHHAYIVAGLWRPQGGHAPRVREWPKETADEMVSSLAEAVDHIASRIADGAPADAPESAPVPVGAV